MFWNHAVDFEELKAGKVWCCWAVAENPVENNLKFLHYITTNRLSLFWGDFVGPSSTWASVISMSTFFKSKNRIGSGFLILCHTDGSKDWKTLHNGCFNQKYFELLMQYHSKFLISHWIYILELPRINFCYWPWSAELSQVDDTKLLTTLWNHWTNEVYLSYDNGLLVGLKHFLVSL